MTQTKQQWEEYAKRVHGSVEAAREVQRLNGRTGGATPTDKLKGFAANRELASAAGKVGGSISRRTK